MDDGIAIQVLADLVGGVLCGPTDLQVFGVADLSSATECDITFLVKSTDIDLLNDSKACCAVVAAGCKATIPIIQVENPVLAITLIHRLFMSLLPVEQEGLADDIVVGDDCLLADSVTAYPRVTLGSRVSIGERVVLESGVVIGDDVVVGDDCHLMANVVIRSICKLGSRIIIQSGTVIGSDGYGYVYDGKGRHIKRPHVGNVILENDVEIGANCCVDRATFGSTIVGQGTKIDNLVQVAHNVTIGQSSLLVSQSGVAGSSVIGNGVVMGGQVAVADHVSVGDGAMIAGKAGVRGRVKPGAVVSGYPAIDHKTWLKASSSFPKLPQLVKQIRRLEKVVAELEEKVS